MMLLATIKDYLNISDTEYDVYLAAQIVEVYARMSDILSVTLSDDSVIQIYELYNSHTIQPGLIIKSVTSLVDDSTNTYTTTHTKTNVFIDSSETLDDTNLTLTYTTTKSYEVDKLALEYLVYFFDKRQDQTNSMYLASKRTQDGLQTTSMPIYEFENWWGNTVAEMLLWV